MNPKVFIICISVLGLIALAQGVKIELLREYETLGTKFDLYDQEYQNGMSTHVTLKDGQCRNLPRAWLKRAQAVDTYGTCGQVFSEKDCQGESTYVYPTRGEQQLKTIKWEKKISSVQGCFVNVKKQSFK